MAQVTLEKEDHARDAEFNRILHGKSSEARGGLTAMRNKDAAAQKAAVDEYFKHWDNKSADEETEEIRAVSFTHMDQNATCDEFSLFCAVVGQKSGICNPNQAVRASQSYATSPPIKTYDF